MFHRMSLEFARQPIMRVLMCLLFLGITCRQWIWSPVIITGQSMLPSWRPGQIAGINKTAYRYAVPRRGDIVFVWTGNELLVKRVIGLPGEQISAREGFFYVNGVRLPEPYVRFTGSWSIAPGKLRAEQFVVAGDNRAQTLISVVRQDRIVGRLTRLL